MFDWNDLRYFLEVARGGTLSAAGHKLGVDHTTVARRLRALEEKLGKNLFVRENRAYKLTPDGYGLLHHAAQMEASSAHIINAMTTEDTGPSGTVRIATLEAFGSQFLSYHCKNFHDHNPGITLEIMAETKLLNFSNRETDLAISLSQHTHGRVISKKVGDYRLRLYAAPSYLWNKAPIISLHDLKKHDFIWYVDDLLPIPELMLLDKAIPNPNITFRTTSVTGQANAAATGLGIALLPCFLADKMKVITSVLPQDISIKRELWLTAHAETAEQPHMEQVMQFLTRLISGERAVLMGKEYA